MFEKTVLKFIKKKFSTSLVEKKTENQPLNFLEP